MCHRVSIGNENGAKLLSGSLREGRRARQDEVGFRATSDVAEENAADLSMALGLAA